MRLLFLVHGLPPTALGGAEIYAHAIASELAQRFGDDVSVLARESDPALPEYSLRRDDRPASRDSGAPDRGGLRVAFLNNTLACCSSFEDSYRNPTAADVALEFVEEVRPELVHVHHLSGLSTDLVVRLAERGIPVLYTLHDYFLICNRGQLIDLDMQRCDGPYESGDDEETGGCGKCVDAFAVAGGSALRATGWAKSIVKRFPVLDSARASLKRLAAKAVQSRMSDDAPLQAMVARRAHMLDLARSVTRFHAPSRTMYEHHLRFGVDARKLELHETGIVQAHLQGIERSASEVLRVGFVGSLIASKAPHLLLEAFDGISPTKATLHVHGGIGSYHGDDSYRRVLEPLLARDSVHYTGPVPHDRIPEVLGHLDVLVVTSVWLENAPLVIQEAFTAGLPVIASDLGGMAEMVKHEENGLLFEVGNADALRRAILRLVDEPGLLERLRSNLPRIRSIESDAAETRAVYEELLGQPGPTDRPR